MKYTIVTIDKIRVKYFQLGLEEYLQRLKPYHEVEFVRLKPVNRKLNIEKIKQEESEKLAKYILADTFNVALHEHGEELTSEKLAQKLEKIKNSGVGEIRFFIGGFAGLTDDFLKQVDWQWSLSQLTFLHEMAQVILLEQLYRAEKINRGEKYHY